MLEEDEKEFCIFVAKIISKEQLDEFSNFNQKLNENSIFIKQKMRENKPDEVNEKLNSLGIPKDINSGQLSSSNNIDRIQEEFNSEIKKRCSSKFFILEMEEYNKIIDKFYSISNGGNSYLDFPVVNEFNILSITVAASINATDKYIRENCDLIYKQFSDNLKK